METPNPSQRPRKWPSRPAYRQMLPEPRARELTELELEDALAACAADPSQDETLVQHAYILWTLGVDGLNRAKSALDEYMLKAIFADAWQTARKSIEVDLERRMDGSLIDGRVLRALREVMGISRTDLSKHFGVTERTLRAWEYNDETYNVDDQNVTTRIWAMWEDWIAETYAVIDASPSPRGIPLLPAGASVPLIKAAILITGGRVGLEQ